MGKVMNIYITLDYELFMGEKVGSVDNCLIIPTNHLLNVLSKFEAKATFFVDAAYLLQLSRLSSRYPSLNKDYISISKQLKDIVAKGHEVQLHIHPQWYKARYEGGRWILNQDIYKISDIDSEELYSIFEVSKSLLEQIIGKQVIAYRAGGYSIQSFENIKKLFKKNGLLIDSSVLSNKTNITDSQYFDYRTIKGGFVYRFSDDVIKIDPNGQFVELPITTHHIPLFRYIYFYRQFKSTPKSRKSKFGDGIPAKTVERRRKKNIFRRVVSTLCGVLDNKVQASIDNGLSVFLDACFRKSINKEIMVIIGHPKNLSASSLEDFTHFLEKNRNCINIKKVSSVLYDKN